MIGLYIFLGLCMLVDAIVDDLGISKATFFAAVGRLMKEGAVTTVSGTRETVFICSTALLSRLRENSNLYSEKEVNKP